MAFSSYGAFRLWFGLLEILGAAGTLNIEPPAVTSALGVELPLWGVFTIYMWIGTSCLNWGLWSVLFTPVITFHLLWFGDRFGIDILVTAGNYVAILGESLAMS